MTVNYADSVIESVKASAVERILLIDDAFDPPPLSAGYEGDLLEVLEGPALRDYVPKTSLGGGALESAIQALLAGDFGHSAVGEAISAVFDAYLHRRVPAVDPGGAFAKLRAPSLEALDPLLELLESCGDSLYVRRVGKEAALRVCGELKPDLILMDFFLSPPDRTAGVLTEEEALADKENSIDLLKRILQGDGGLNPAVILMSSGDVEEHAHGYRTSLDGRVTALRFGFLRKSWIRQSGQEVIVEGDAADVLIDTSGSLEFGRTLESALREWKRGVETGLEEFYQELRDLDVKDFAYLLRFRLYEEAEPFADYLEWLLGESLRAIVDDTVEWNTNGFSRLDNPELTEAIEGARPTPALRTAQLYHRIRFNLRRNRVRTRYNLGDLFISTDKESVRMVITPDSHIIERNGKRSASHLLTVGGTVRDVSDEQALAGHLLIVSGRPKAVTWRLRDVVSHDFDDIAELQVREAKPGCRPECPAWTTYSYYATMRALPAQAIQKDVLGDLARVGSAVPPTVDVFAPVSVYVRRKVQGQSQRAALDGLQDTYAQVFMPRGGPDRKPLALFTRRFVTTLLAELARLNEAELSREDLGHRNNWIGVDIATKVRTSMSRKGVRLPGNGVFGLSVSVGVPREKSWLEIVVDVSDDELIDVQGIDPLAR